MLCCGVHVHVAIDYTRCRTNLKGAYMYMTCDGLIVIHHTSQLPLLSVSFVHNHLSHPYNNRQKYDGSKKLQKKIVVSQISRF